LVQTSEAALARQALDSSQAQAKLRAQVGDSSFAMAYYVALSKPDVFRKYLDRLPGEFNVDAHAKVIGDLLQDKSDLELVALAHFEALVKLGADSKIIETLAGKLKLTKVEGRWASADGAQAFELRKALKEERAPGEAAGSWDARYLRACALLRAALKTPDLIESLYKSLSVLKTPHTDALAANVKPFIVCKRCKGQGKKPCDRCQEKGELTVVCSQCQGSGQLYKGQSGRTGKDIIESCPSCKGKGKWQVDCPTCENGVIVCPACKGAEAKTPTLADWVASDEPCKMCGGSGFALQVVRHPCAFCKGLGAFLKPKGAEGKLVGPTE
jgi:hypothetical protein